MILIRKYILCIYKNVKINKRWQSTEIWYLHAVCFFLRKLKYGGNIFFLEVIYFLGGNILYNGE